MATNPLAFPPTRRRSSIPSPPPPPQRRRSSLVISRPSLETLLSTAPQANLTDFMASSSLRGRRAMTAARSSTLLSESIPLSIGGAPPLQSYSTSVVQTTVRRTSPRAPGFDNKRKPPSPSVEGSVQKKNRLDPSNLAEASLCCICMSMPSSQELALIDSCKHHFCFSCIQHWSNTENSCPLCKSRFSTIERVCDGISVHVKQRDQRSEASQALEGLLQSLAANRNSATGNHRFGRYLLRTLGGVPAAGGSEEDDDDDVFLPGFMNVFLRGTITDTTTTTRTRTFTSPGISIDTAIEIDDSSVEDEDEETEEIEVVRVASSTSGRGLESTTASESS